MATPRKLRSQGAAEDIDLDHPVPLALRKDWRGLTDIDEQLSFYSSYHHTEGNKAVHFVFVPVILWTSIYFLSLVKLSSSSPVRIGPNMAFQPNLALLIGVPYMAYCIVLEKFGGILYTIIVTIFYSTATYCSQIMAPNVSYNGYSLTQVVIGLFALSWVAQFMGHGFIEKRAPALMDNLVQALFLAPFFVLFEGLFALNYRPALQKRVEIRATQRIKAMNAAKKR